MNEHRPLGTRRSREDRNGSFRRGWRGPVRAGLIIGAAATLGFVGAQSAVEVSPPVLLHEGALATPLDAAFAVKNPTAVPLLVRVSLSDWHYLADGTPNYLEAGSLSRSLAPFVTFNPAELLLEPGETSEVRYTVELPATAEPGSYWGVLFMEAEDPDPVPGFKLASFSVRVGHVVYVNVPPLAQDGQIVGIFGEPPSGPADGYALQIQYANMGTAVQRLTGYVELRDGQGQVLFHEELPTTVSLPGDVVGRTFDVFGPLDPGNYTALVVYNYGDETIDVAADYPFALVEALVDPGETTVEGP